MKWSRIVLLAAEGFINFQLLGLEPGAGQSKSKEKDFRSVK